MSIPVWIIMTLTGIAGLAFGIHIGDSHRKRLEKDLAARNKAVEELSEKIKDKDRIISEVRRDSARKVVKAGSAAAVVQKTSPAAKKPTKQPKKDDATTGKKAIAEASMVDPEKDPSKLLAVS